MMWLVSTKLTDDFLFCCVAPMVSRIKQIVFIFTVRYQESMMEMVKNVSQSSWRNNLLRFISER